MALSVDKVLEQIGSFGWYQIRLVAILAYMYWVNFACQVMLLTFVATEPAWHCVANSTACNLTGEFKPGDDNYDFRCGNNVSRADWEFADSFTSIVTEFNLICDDAVLATVANSIVFAGWPVGSLIGGFILDKVGRKPGTIVSLVLSSLFGAVSASPNVYWFFVLCRFLVGISIGTFLWGLLYAARFRNGLGIYATTEYWLQLLKRTALEVFVSLRINKRIYRQKLPSTSSTMNLQQSLSIHGLNISSSVHKRVPTVSVSVWPVILSVHVNIWIGKAVWYSIIA